MRFRFESPSLEKMLLDFVNAGQSATADVRQVVSKGALNIRIDAKARIEAQRNMGKYPNYLPRYSKTITYSIITVGDETEAVIGPDHGMEVGGKKVQGFAGFIEYGTPTSPPMPHMNPALDEEDPKFMLALAETVMGYLR